jgi:ribosomal protein S18 acetylase RimI-like enzyme
MTITYRHTITETDPATVRTIVQSSGFFNPEEIDVAVELAQTALDKGCVESGYHFIFLETDGRTAGYSCFGRIAGTQSSFDLYWIAVHDDFRGRGLGKQLLAETERTIAGMGGHRIYIETSSKEKYTPTQKFYVSAHYILEAVLKDFYAPGDGKMILVKEL